MVNGCFCEAEWLEPSKPVAAICMLSASEAHHHTLLLFIGKRGERGEINRWTGLPSNEAGVETGRLQACLGPPRPLLEAVTDLVWGFSDGKVGLDVAAVPLGLLHLHAQGKVLCHCVLGRPPCLAHSLAPDQEVGTCTASDLPSGSLIHELLQDPCTSNHQKAWGHEPYIAATAALLCLSDCRQKPPQQWKVPQHQVGRSALM